MITSYVYKNVQDSRAAGCPAAQGHARQLGFNVFAPINIRYLYIGMLCAIAGLYY